jgi:hypothetical protein
MTHTNSAIGRLASGETHGDTRGDTLGIPYPPAVSPSSHENSHLNTKRSQIARQAESTPTRPSGSQSPPPRRIPFSDGSIFPLRSRHTIMAFSQMDVVASLGALLRWSRPRCASLWLCIGKHETRACSFVGDCDEVRPRLVEAPSVRDLLGTILSFGDCDFQKIAILRFRVFQFFCCLSFPSLDAFRGSIQKIPCAHPRARRRRPAPAYTYVPFTTRSLCCRCAVLLKRRTPCRQTSLRYPQPTIRQPVDVLESIHRV